MNAWGLVTSWTRWRSTARTAGAPGSWATTWSSQIFSTRVRGLLMAGGSALLRLRRSRQVTSGRRREVTTARQTPDSGSQRPGRSRVRSPSIAAQTSAGPGHGAVPRPGRSAHRSSARAWWARSAARRACRSVRVLDGQAAPTPARDEGCGSVVARGTSLPLSFADPSHDGMTGVGSLGLLPGSQPQRRCRRRDGRRPPRDRAPARPRLRWCIPARPSSLAPCRA